MRLNRSNRIQEELARAMLGILRPAADNSLQQVLVEIKPNAA